MMAMALEYGHANVLGVFEVSPDFLDGRYVARLPTSSLIQDLHLVFFLLGVGVGDGGGCWVWMVTLCID